MKLYRVNEHYFDQIDTPEKAYWLGFLLADGAVSKGKSLRLMLKASDREHVEKFAIAIGTTTPIKTRLQNGAHPVVYVDVHSKQLLDSLATYGVVQNKSLTVGVPNISESLIVDFWRGVFDGDGCISKSQRKNRKDYKWTVHLVGSQIMVSAFVEFVCGFSDSEAKLSKTGNAYQIYYTGSRTPQAITNVLYKDATVALERKRHLAVELSKVACRRYTKR